MVETYAAVRLEVQSDFSSISIQQLPFQEVGENDLLIRMEFSTMNPSDFLAATGNYAPVPTPYTMGFEGSGTVVKTGTTELALSLLNKRVACRGRGTWAEYIKVDAEQVFPLLDSTTFEQASNLIVNPMTVALFIERIQQANKPAIQNAAASALGKMLVKWCNLLNLPLVNLVRRQEQAEILRNIGAKYVFDTSQDGWKVQAKALCDELGVAIGFDAIAGAATQDLADLVIDGGVVYNYGLLSGENCVVSPMNLIFKRKVLDGLWLGPWLASKTYEERVQVGYTVQNLINDVLSTEHSDKIINLTELKDWVIKFKETSATNNKILIRNRLE